MRPCQSTAVAVQSDEETRFTLHYPRNDSGCSGPDITGIVVTPPIETHSKAPPVSPNLPVTHDPGARITVEPASSKAAPTW